MKNENAKEKEGSVSNGCDCGNHKISIKALESMAELPPGQRGQAPIGRNGEMRSIRKYHLSQDKISEFETKKTTNGWVNPYDGRNGAYFFQVEALHALGLNEWHSFVDVFEKIKSLMEGVTSINPSNKSMSNAWMNFIGKKVRKGTSGNKDVEGRVMQNFRVLQRVVRENGSDKNAYGRKLQQLCMAIDIKFVPMEGSSDLTLGSWHYRLNTEFPSIEKVLPIYDSGPGRKRGRRPKNKAEAEVEMTPEGGDIQVVVEEVINSSLECVISNGSVDEVNNNDYVPNVESD